MKAFKNNHFRAYIQFVHFNNLFRAFFKLLSQYLLLSLSLKIWDIRTISVNQHSHENSEVNSHIHFTKKPFTHF